MEEPKKVFVSIYCMIYPDCFSDEMIDRMATGQEIYDFLMEDTLLWQDEHNDYEPIPGDCNLWYLGCNEKFGILKYKEISLQWDFGESSFDRVEAFVTMLYVDRLFTTTQYRNLMAKIEEGREFDCMNDIKGYLLAKRDGLPWVKSKDAAEFRTNMKKYVARVKKHIQDEGSLLYSPTTH